MKDCIKKLIGERKGERERTTAISSTLTAIIMIKPINFFPLIFYNISTCEEKENKKLL